MVIAVGVIGALLIGTTALARLVPGRLQSLAEMSYEFVATTLRSTAGKEGMRFFPLVFSLFMFILVVERDRAHPLHVHGDEPHHHHGRVRAAGVPHRHHLRLLASNGLHFFKLFVPNGIPIYILPLVVFIEVLSFCRGRSRTACGCSPTCWPATSRSRCSRGFVTMLAGSASSAGSAPCCRSALTVALTALEFLVAFLQAYVFAILTCIYLNDAIHPGH